MSEHQGALADQVAALRRMAEAEAEGRREMERAVEDSRDRERRLLKAVAALEGVPLGATKAAPKKKPAAHAWSVSAGTLEAVYAAAVRLTEGNGGTFTRKQLGEEAGRSSDVVRRALNTLREQERIRHAGKGESVNGRGIPPNLYALMPNGD